MVIIVQTKTRDRIKHHVNLVFSSHSGQFNIIKQKRELELLVLDRME